MNQMGFYDGPAGSTPDREQSVNLYNDPVSEQVPEDVPNYTGNKQVDAWIHSLPEEKRGTALEEVTKPMTGEEIARVIDENRGFRFSKEQDFIAYNEFRRNEERSTLADLADGASMMGDIITTALSQVGDTPGEAALKFVPSVVEGAYQSLRDTLGMVSQSTNPNSPVFRFRHALFGTGTIQDQMRQLNEALEFNEYGDKLLRGEATAVIDKDLVHPGVTQVAAILADPTALVPFGKAAKIVGLENLAMKGARALGAGATLAEVAIKAQKIKTAVMAGSLKWGVGMPLDLVGGAVSGTIDYSINKFGRVVEFSTGIGAEDVSRATRLAGAGTATAGLAGVNVPFATTASTAYFAGGMAKGAGEAVALLSEQMRKQGGYRGLFSYAEEALMATEEELAKRGGALNPATKKMLKLIDKVDPFISYGADVAEGAAWGGIIGGGLGALNEGEKGFGFGIGTGAVGGVVGAGVGRLTADVSGSTFMERLHVTAEFARRLYIEKDPISGMFIKRIMDDPRAGQPEFKLVMDKFAIALGKVDGQISFRALSSEEFKRYREYLERNDLIGDPSMGHPVDPTPERFRNAEGYTIKRMKNGTTEVVINTDYIFKKNGDGRFTVAHEFLHGFLVSTTLSEQFKGLMRNAILGHRDAAGRVITKGSVPFSEVKDFIKSYWLQGVESLSKEAAQYRSGVIKTWTDAIERLEKQGESGVKPLSDLEWSTIDKVVEEFTAHYFSAWFDGADAHMLARGGEHAGMRGLIDSVKTAFLDAIEEKINLHNPLFGFHKGVGGGYGDVTKLFYKDGKRVRIGAIDHLIRDMYKLSSGLRSKGYIDVSGMRPEAARSFFENSGLDDVVKKDARGRWVPKDPNLTAAEKKVLGASAQTVLEGIEPSARTSTMHADGVIRGPFSDIELKALVDAGLMSRQMADNFKLLQLLANDKTGTNPNVIEFGYVGAERGLSETNDNLRASGDRVPFTNRKALLIEAIGEVSKDGNFSFRIRSLDMKVMERRAMNVWANARVREMWNGDFNMMMSDFYGLYLNNMSKDHADATRRPSAALWLSDGEFKRDVMHQIAGFAKGENTPYINMPLAQVPRGTLSAVTDFSVGRMHVIRPSEMHRYNYVHENAFRDIAANFKLAHAKPENAPGGVAYRTPIGYVYKRDKNGVTVVDPVGDVVSREASVSAAEQKALSDFESRAQGVFLKKASEMHQMFGAQSGFYKLWSNAAEIDGKVASVIQNIGDASTLDFTADTMHLILRTLNGAGPEEVGSLMSSMNLNEGKDSVYKGFKRKGQGDYFYQFRIPEHVSTTVAGTALNWNEQGGGSVLRFRDVEVPSNGWGSPRVADMLYKAAMMESIRKFGRFATFAWHFSAQPGVHRTMRFDESFQKLHGGNLEPGFWLAPSLSKTWAPNQFAEGKQGGAGERLIDIKDPSFIWGETAGGKPLWSLPALFTMVYGQKPAYHIYNKLFQTLDHLARNPDMLKVLMDADLGGPYNGLQNVRAIDMYGSHSNMLEAVRRGRDLLPSGKDLDPVLSSAIGFAFRKSEGRISTRWLDDLVHEVTGSAMREYAAKGHDIVVWDDLSTRDPLRSLNITPLSPHRMGVNAETSGPRPSQANIIPLWSNVNQEMTGRRTDSAPYEIVGKSLSDIKFPVPRGKDRGGMFKMLPSFAEFVKPVVDDKMAKHVDMYLKGLFDERNSSTKEAVSARNDLANSFGMRFIPIKGSRVLDFISLMEDLKRKIEEEIPMLPEGDFESSLGEIKRQSAIKAKHEHEMSIIYESLYGLFSRLDDDFIHLMEDGRMWMHDSAPENSVRPIRLANSYLDRYFGDAGSQTETSNRTKEQKDKIVAFLSTLSEEFKGVAGGMFELRVVERKAVSLDQNGDGVPYSKDIKFVEDSPTLPRLTFVWSDAASELRQFYMDKVGSDALFDGNGNALGWEALRSNREVIIRLSNDAEFARQQQELSAKIESFRTETANYYRGFLTKAENHQRAYNDLANSVETYASYIEKIHYQRREEFSKRTAEHVSKMDPSMFLGESPEEVIREIAVGRYELGQKLLDRANKQDSLGVKVRKIEEILRNISENEASGRLPAGTKHFMLMQILKESDPSALKDYTPIRPDNLDQSTYDYIKAELKQAQSEDGIITGMSTDIANVIKNAGERYASLAFEGTLRSGLTEAVDTALAKFPTGITAQNLIKELERINSTLPVLEEARITGFADYLKEKAKAPRDPETGKFPKLDMQEVRDFLEANKIDIYVQKNAKFDVSVQAQQQYTVHPHNGEVLSYGNLVVRAKETSPRIFPASNRGNHVGEDTYVWIRYTIRQTSDGKKILYIEENQAQNNLEARSILQDEEKVTGQVVNLVNSQTSLEHISKLMSMAVSEQRTGLPMNEYIAETFSSFGIDGDYYRMSWLRELANARSYNGNNAKSRIVGNALAGTYLRYIGGVGKASLAQTSGMLAHTNGSALINYVNSQMLSGKRTVDRIFIQHMRDHLMKEIKTQTAVAIYGKDGETMSVPVHELIMKDLDRVGDEGFRNYLTFDRYNSTAGIVNAVMNNLVEPGTFEKIIEMSVDEIIRKFREEGKRGDTHVSAWQDAFEEVMKSSSLRKKIADFTKEKVLTKELKIPAPDADHGYAIIKFTTVNGAANFYKEVTRMLFRNMSSTGHDNYLFDGAWLPSVVRDSLRNRLSFMRDRAIVELSSRVLRSPDMMASLSELVADEFGLNSRDTSAEFAAYGIGQNTAETKVGEALSGLLEMNFGGNSQGLYYRALNRLQLACESGRIKNPEWISGRDPTPPSEGIPDNYAIQSATTNTGSTTSDFNTIYRATHDANNPVGRNGIVPSQVNLMSYVKGLLGEDSFHRSMKNMENHNPRLVVDNRGPGEEPVLRGGRLDATGNMSYGLLFDLAANINNTFNTSTGRNVLNALTKIQENSNADFVSTEEFKAGNDFLKGPLRSGLQLLADTKESWSSGYGGSRAFEHIGIDASDLSYSGSTTKKFVHEVGKIITRRRANDTPALVVEDLQRAIGAMLFKSDHEKRLRELERVPFLESKEYFGLSAKMALRLAMVENVDGIVITNASDGGSNSNLNPGKAMDIYEVLTPAQYSKVYGKLGVKMRPPQSPRPVTMLPESQHAELSAAAAGAKDARIKMLGDLVSIKKAHKMGSVFSPKPATVSALKEFYLACRNEFGGTLGETDPSPSAISTAVETVVSDSIKKFEKRMSANGDEVMPKSRPNGGNTMIARTARDPIGDMYSVMMLYGVMIGSAGEVSPFKEKVKESHAVIQEWMSEPFIRLLYPDNFETGIKIKMKTGASTSEAVPYSRFRQITAGVEGQNAVRASAILETATFLKEAGKISSETFEMVRKVSEIIMSISAESAAYREMVLNMKNAKRSVTEALLGRSIPDEEWASGPNATNATDIYARSIMYDPKNVPESTRQAVMEKGQTFWKLASGSPEAATGSEVGYNTRAWRSGFIGTAAAQNPDIVRKSRLITKEISPIGGDGASLSVSLIPRGFEKLGEDSSRIEVMGTMLPNKTAMLYAISTDASGELTSVAMDELKTRLSTFGVTRFQTDGWSATESSTPKAMKAAEVPYKLANFESIYANHTPQGREIVDRINTAGMTLNWGMTGGAEHPTSVYDGKSVTKEGFYALTVNKGNSAQFGIYTKVKFTGNKATASIQSSIFPKHKLERQTFPKNAYITLEERAMADAISRHQSQYTDVELKQVMLAELMNRLKAMGVDHVENLLNIMPLPQDRIVDPSSGDYSSELIPPAIALGKSGQLVMPYEHGAEILREENIEFTTRRDKYNTRWQEMSAKIPEGISYKLAWTSKQEGNGMTISSDNGYFISVVNEKYRLFSPERKLIGVFDDEEKARRKAEAISRKTKS